MLLIYFFILGSEFINQQFKNFCKEHNIKLFHNYTSVHASFVERFNLTLKRLIYSYMTENETNRYVDALPLLMQTYNNRKHRMIGMTPTEAEDPVNHPEVDKKIQKYYDKTKPKKPKFIIGQLVRIALQKTKFTRGFKNQTNEEIFKIKNIKTNLPIPLYILEEYDGSEEIKGGFYAHELTPVNTDVFRVEKVLRKKNVRGKKKLYVKWKGFSDKYNSWIDEEDIKETFNG